MRRVDRVCKLVLHVDYKAIGCIPEIYHALSRTTELLDRPVGTKNSPRRLRSSKIVQWNMSGAMWSMYASFLVDSYVCRSDSGLVLSQYSETPS